MRAQRNGRRYRSIPRPFFFFFWCRGVAIFSPQTLPLVKPFLLLLSLSLHLSSTKPFVVLFLFFVLL